MGKKSKSKRNGSRRARSQSQVCRVGCPKEGDKNLPTLMDLYVKSILDEIAHLEGCDADGCISLYDTLKQIQQKYLEPLAAGQLVSDRFFTEKIARRKGSILKKLSEQVELQEKAGIRFQHKGLERFANDTLKTQAQETETFNSGLSEKDRLSSKDFPKLVRIKTSQICVLSLAKMPASGESHSPRDILSPVLEAVDSVNLILSSVICEKKHNYFYFYYLSSLLSFTGILLNQTYDWCDYNETSLEGMNLFSCFFQALSVVVMPFVNLVRTKDYEPSYIKQYYIKYLSDFLSDLINRKEDELGVKLLSCWYVRHFASRHPDDLKVLRLQYNENVLKFMHVYPTKEQQTVIQAKYRQYHTLLLNHPSSAHSHLAYECKSYNPVHHEVFLIESVFALGQLHFKQGEIPEGIKVYNDFIDKHSCLLCDKECQMTNTYYVTYSINILVTLIAYATHSKKESYKFREATMENGLLEKYFTMLELMILRTNSMGSPPELTRLIRTARSILDERSCRQARPTFEQCSLFIKQTCCELEHCIGCFEKKLGEIKEKAYMVLLALTQMLSSSCVLALSLDDIFDLFMPIFNLPIIKNYFHNSQKQMESFFYFRNYSIDEKAYRPWMVWAKMGCANSYIMLLSLSKLNATLEAHESPHSLMMLYWLCLIHFSITNSTLYVLAPEDIVQSKKMIISICEKILRAAPTNLNMIMDSKSRHNNFHEFVTSLYYLHYSQSSSEAKASTSQLLKRLRSLCQQPSMQQKLQKSAQGKPISSKLQTAVEDGIRCVFASPEVAITAEGQVVAGMPPVDIVLTINEKRFLIQVDGPQHYDLDLKSNDPYPLVLRTKDALRDWIYAELGCHVIRLKWCELSEYMGLVNGRSAEQLTDHNSSVVLAKLLLAKCYSLTKAGDSAPDPISAMVHLLQKYILEHDSPALVSENQGVEKLRQILDLMPPLNLLNLIKLKQLGCSDNLLLHQPGSLFVHPAQSPDPKKTTNVTHGASSDRKKLQPHSSYSEVFGVNNAEPISNADHTGVEGLGY